jgi:hypothetical protein
MKILLFALVLIVVCKLLNRRMCSECGSILMMTFVRKKIGWGQDYGLVSGIFSVQFKVEICACCRHEFVKEIRLKQPSQKQLMKYIKMELECLR